MTAPVRAKMGSFPIHRHCRACDRSCMTTRLPLLLIVGSLTVALAACAPTRGVSPVQPAASTASSRYQATAFAVPFSAEVPSGIGSAVTLDNRLVSWYSHGPKAFVIRVLSPHHFYAPGSSVRSPVPDDYLSYLVSLAGRGVEFSERGTIDVGGHSAVIMTVDVPSGTDLPGSIGCFDAESTGPQDACFGFRSRVHMRLMALDLGDEVVVAWAQATSASGDIDGTALFAHFDRMMSTMALEPGPN